MDKLNRLGWVAGTCVDAFGLRIGIRVNRREALDALEVLLPPTWTPAPAAAVDRLFSLWVGGQAGRVRGYNLVYAGIARRARTLDLEEAYCSLEAELRQAVAAGARRVVFVHAGVVGWRGRAILVPGRSGAGKTTLVAELIRAGATYYSDEFAVLDERGRVRPFAKPLSIRGERGAVVSTPASALGGRAGREPLRPLLIALCHFRESSRWRPTRLTRGQALLSVLRHTVPVRRRPAAALTALKAALSSAVVLKGARGDVALAAAAILRAADRQLQREERLGQGQGGSREA